MSTTTGAWDRGVYDPSQLTTPFIDSNHNNLDVLSATSNEMVLNLAGTQNGTTQVIGLLYDNITTSYGALSTISLTSPDGGTSTTIGTKLSAGGTVVLIDKNYFSVEYTLPVGGAATVVPANSGRHNTGPNLRRLYILGYI